MHGKGLADLADFLGSGGGIFFDCRNNKGKFHHKQAKDREQSDIATTEAGLMAIA